MNRCGSNACSSFARRDTNAACESLARTRASGGANWLRIQSRYARRYDSAASISGATRRCARACLFTQSLRPLPRFGGGVVSLCNRLPAATTGSYLTHDSPSHSRRAYRDAARLLNRGLCCISSLARRVTHVLRPSPKYGYFGGGVHLYRSPGGSQPVHRACSHSSVASRRASRWAYSASPPLSLTVAGNHCHVRASIQSSRRSKPLYRGAPIHSVSNSFVYSRSSADLSSSRENASSTSYSVRRKLDTSSNRSSIHSPRGVLPGGFGGGAYGSAKNNRRVARAYRSPMKSYRAAARCIASVSQFLCLNA